jgi:hypothetical protein
MEMTIMSETKPRTRPQQQDRVHKAMQTILRDSRRGSDLSGVTEIRITPQYVYVTRLLKDEETGIPLTRPDTRGGRQLVTETESFNWHEPPLNKNIPLPDEPDEVLLHRIRHGLPFEMPRGHKAFYAEHLLKEVGGEHFPTKHQLCMRLKMSTSDINAVARHGHLGYRQYKREKWGRVEKEDV